MPTFNNLKSLENYLMKNNKDVLKLIGLQIEKEMKDFIMRELYQKYNPSDYSRTYEYINSLTVSQVYENKDGYEIEIFFDSDKINAREVSDRYWNQHMSVDGSDFAEFLPYAIEYGTSGSLYDRKGIKVVETTINELKNGDLIKKAINILKSKGFNVKVK